MHYTSVIFIFFNYYKKLVTELALNTYILESITYYIGGMLDENLVIATDIERAIIHVCLLIYSL